MRWARKVAVVLAALLAMMFATAPAQAQAKKKPSKKMLERKVPLRKAKFRNYRGWAAMTVGWRDVVSKKIRKKLLSGLPTTIVTRAYVFPYKKYKPVALGGKTCRIVYDLWDEVFRIELRQGGRRRKTVAVNVEGVLRRCAEARTLPIVHLKKLKRKRRYFVGVVVEVNPLSKKMLEKIKRWVTLPKGVGALGPGDSLFGSFVGLFITHVPAADKTLRFRTSSFRPRKLPKVKIKKRKARKKSKRK